MNSAKNSTNASCSEAAYQESCLPGWLCLGSGPALTKQNCMSLCGQHSLKPLKHATSWSLLTPREEPKTTANAKRLYSNAELSACVNKTVPLSYFSWHNWICYHLECMISHQNQVFIWLETDCKCGHFEIIMVASLSSSIWHNSTYYFLKHTTSHQNQVTSMPEPRVIEKNGF